MESIYIGSLFIVLGILIKFFPGLLAGYNSLSNREKENAETNRLPTFAAIVFGVMGLISITGYFVGFWLDRPSLSNIWVLVTLVGMIVLIVFGNMLVNRRAR
ncbi:DUF3784 domain-containing protein [Algoriphagus sp. C2-6-M1]|uniref:DUF3784 domain-containing protein n=1 Tax=Algoriphagus persicinus TaxID=3108754 RepID=UPI002B375B9D|nr:DUF3784 domain-containing protein [Algoriphagus sp. C2-6-M1]MEB2780074.1 DUF3784 domain-containing protein [Algoriphagus sp. C2-6-M1]